MPKVLKSRRVSNPRKRRKKLSAKQIRFFGTKAQRARLKGKRSNPKRRRRKSVVTVKTRVIYRTKRRRAKARKRRRNVGQILTASLAGLNPGRKKGMARRRRKARVGNRRRRRVTNRRVVHHRRRRRSNPGRSKRVVYRYRGRKRSGGRRRNGRRRNPGMLSGTAGQIVGVIGGAAVTSMLSAAVIPAQFSTGIMGYIATGIVAMVQGKLIGKVTKNASLGKDMMVGGFTFVALKVISDMLPSISGMLPFSLKGLGLIAPSSFYNPQVNLPGSMSNFVVPSATPIMVSAGMHGLGRSARRVGRMGY